MKPQISFLRVYATYALVLLVSAACAKISDKVSLLSSEQEASLLAGPSNFPQELTQVPSTPATPPATNPNPINDNFDEPGSDGGYIPNPGTGTGGGDGGTIPNPLRPASLAIAPQSFDFGVKSINSINHVVFLVTNTGEKVATSVIANGLTGAFSFRDGAYPGTLGDCTDQLAGGASCRLVVSFRPIAAQIYQGSLSVTHAGGNTLTVPLRGQGTGIATLRISNLINDNEFFNYGQLAFGSNMTKTFKVIYSGVKPATGVNFSGVTAPYSIVRNACGEVVSADCELDITFNATAVGSQQKKLKVTYHNSAYSAEANHDLYAETAAQIVPTSLTVDNLAIGDVLVGGAFERIIRVRKAGNTPATSVTARSFSNSEFSYKGGQFPGVGGTCEATINSDCLLVILFNPNRNGAFSDRVLLDYSDGSQTRFAQNSLTATAVNPALITITPAVGYYTDFGLVSMGYPKDHIFTVTNTAGRMSATNVVVPAMAAPYSRIATDCSGTLLSGASCRVTVRFIPASTTAANTNLVVNYHNAAQSTSASLGLTGAGDSGATLTFGGKTYDFGSVVIGQVTYIDVEIYYYGTLVAEGCQIQITDPTGGGSGGPVFGFPNGDPYSGSTCTPGGINQRCTFRIVFTPGQELIYRTELTITYQTGTGTTETITVPVQGKGTRVAPAVVAVTPSISFGNVTVGQTKTARVQVQRSGQLSATSVAASVTGSGYRFAGGTYPGVGGTCGTEIALQQTSCDVVVEFAPASVGVSTGELLLNYFDGAATQSARTSLQGNGYKAAYLAMMGFSFGKLPAGTSAEIVATVQNTGTDDASSIGLNSVPAPFSIVEHDCIGTLAPSQSCNVKVKISSSNPGEFNSSVAVNYHNGVQATQATSAAQARAVVPVLVAANGNHSCARTDLGKMKCWGHGAEGQLGLGSTANRGEAAGQMGSALPAVNVGTGRWVKSIALGYWHSCAVLDDGKLKCWGANATGQLGIGSSVARVGTVASEMGDALKDVNLGESIREVTAGYQHTCALTESGRVACWGANVEGQLGLGHTEDRGRLSSHMSQVFVSLEANAVSISAGPSHTCAILSTGALKCWGNNLFGQLAQGDTENRGDQAGEMGTALNDIQLGDGTRALQVASGGAYTCAIDSEKNVRCWGRNELGVLGAAWCQDSGAAAGPCSDPRYAYSLPGLGISMPQIQNGFAVVNLGTGFKAKQISTDNGNICALSEAGQVKCWGDNEFGQLGRGNTTVRGLTAAEMGDNLAAITLGQTARQISAGGNHACAVLADETIRCWGGNKYGALGLGDVSNRGDNAGEMPPAAVAY